MLAEDKQPQLGIASSFLEAGEGGGGGFAADRVALDALVGKFALFGGKPSGRERIVGESEDGAEGNDKCHDALQDEQPSPSRYACDVIEAFEYSGGDEACEGGGEDVAGVEDGYAGCDLFARIEYGEPSESLDESGRGCWSSYRYKAPG